MSAPRLMVGATLPGSDRDVWTGEVGSLRWASRQVLGAHQRALGALACSPYRDRKRRFPRNRTVYAGLGDCPKSLRVFGCLPVTARGAAWRQASEKPRRRKPRGEYAPAAVSVYGLKTGRLLLLLPETLPLLQITAGAV